MDAAHRPVVNRPLVVHPRAEAGASAGTVDVLFADMNAFFASVEQWARPELRGRPVAVAALDTENTACIAVSYEARPFGIRTGTPVWEARRLCPDITIVASRPQSYVEAHHRIRAAFESCLPVEKVESIDEMWGRLLGDQRNVPIAFRVGESVRRAILRDAGETLECSIGLAPNRFLAKVASELGKRAAPFVITKADLPDVLHDLSLVDLPGIGARMERRLHRAGITSVEQLCRQSPQQLYWAWGSVVGRMWWHWLRGEEWYTPPSRRRSLGHSHVLPPEFRNEEGARAVCLRLIHKAAARLRDVRCHARRMSLYLSFTYREEGWRAETVLGLTQSTRQMVAAFCKLWPHRPRGNPTQVAIDLYDLVPDSCATLPLFEEDRRDHVLDHLMDRINARFGKDAVFLASAAAALHTAPVRIAFGQIPGFRPACAG